MCVYVSFCLFHTAASGNVLLYFNAIVCFSLRNVPSLNGETVAAGVVTCLIAYPLYLLVFTLFRMSRSKVTQTCLKLKHDQGFSHSHRPNS